MPIQNTFPALPPDVLNPRDIGVGEHNLQPDDPNYAWHLLAEGDSWFTIAAIPSSNLLYGLRLARWTLILNLAYPGDTIRHMSELSDHKDLVRFLAQQNFCSRFDALLLSGGGNDLIDTAAELIHVAPSPGVNPQDPGAYIDETQLSKLLSNIQDGYKRIVELRDALGGLSRGAPAFLHTYDYVTPRNAPGRLLGTVAIKGPWLWPIFKNSALGVSLQQRIADRLIDRLAEALLALDSDRGALGKKLPAFHVVDTRHTLLPANPCDVGTSNDWLNEIHPNMAGYNKIAARLSDAVNARLMGV
jgi:lysophospholipase L1-like esterase